MTILEAIDYANRHSCLELYELGVKDGKHEAILQQANHDQAVQNARAEVIDECISLLNKIEDEYRAAICDIDCMQDAPFLDGILSAMFTVIQSIKQLKEQK